ncbi:unnamed protein product, partial [Iphiclides podalirius]
MGPNNYKIGGKDGEILHRHIDQLKRKSLRPPVTCPSELNSEHSTNSINELPTTKEVGDVRSEQVASRDEPGGLVGSEVELVPEVLASEKVSDTPGSPIFEDASPNVTPPLQGRPIWQCRLRKLIKHYD